MGNRIQRFEDFIAWQKARELTKMIYQTTSDSGFSRDWALRDQMRRAAVSIMANIAEGFERGRPGEFKQYLSMSKASCAELRSHLYVALDAGHIDRKAWTALMSTADEAARIIGALRVSVERRLSNPSPITHHPSPARQGS